MWNQVILVAVTLSVVASCQYKKNECPDYTVVEQHADYEIRSYPAITWVSTAVQGNSPRIGQYTAFMRLFRYISGNNDKEQKIEMTVPVRIQQLTNETVMDFFVPLEFADNTPVPKDEKVKIIKEGPTLYAVRSFGGYIWRSSRWVEEAGKLANSLKNDETVDKNVYYRIGYDAPFDFFDRRNEIWMVKRENLENNDIFSNI